MEKFINRPKRENGTVVIFVAIVLIILLGFAALAIDIGHITVTKNELQNVADASALAAARKIGSIYETMTYEEQQNYVCNPDEIKEIAKEVGIKNQADKKYITINDEDIIIGQWNPQTKTLTPTLNQPDAVRVIARRDSSANQPISNFFAKIFGKDTTDVRADAIAALTGDSTAEEGGLFVPVGIPRRWFEDPDFCNKPIKFHPTCPHEPCTGLGCAGWNGFTYGHSAIIVRRILTGELKSPETIAYKTYFDFTGGDLGGNFDYFKELFDEMKGKNDGVYDSDNDSNTWTTRVVVYDWNDCSNPSGEILIVGFSTVTIYEVLPPPDKTIMGIVKCNNVEPGRGGGGYYGTKGSIPGLVE